jgi:hypothetical protein
VTGGNRGLERIGAARVAELSGTLKRGKTALYEELVPQCAVLVEEEDWLSGFAHAGG